jgi:hypothetical protein
MFGLSGLNSLLFDCNVVLHHNPGVAILCSMASVKSGKSSSSRINFFPEIQSYNFCEISDKFDKNHYDGSIPTKLIEVHVDLNPKKTTKNGLKFENKTSIESTLIKNNFTKYIMNKTKFGYYYELKTDTQIIIYITQS